MARQQGAHGRGGPKKKGQAGAAKNYITRTQAIRKLQCTLADFRRLCILKGIYPREPRSKKKANKGSSAPSSFYYAKDIQYLLHEPVLDKLREHKAFAKRLSRAVGRREWGLAKNLEESKPVYRLDHIIKERYPTFVDTLRDLDDALSLVVLFAGLPASPTIPASIIDNCAKLTAQWQLYVMRTRSLRKVFLSIKGIYFQAEVHGQPVTWLVPYMFTQNIPSDLDFRIMLTFLELYQTMLGFVFYKLYTDNNLVYPPKLDAKLEEGGAGIGALLLEETGTGLVARSEETADQQEKKKTHARDVRRRIKHVSNSKEVEAAAEADDAARAELALEPTSAPVPDDELDVFPTGQGDELPTVRSDTSSSMFEPYYFFLSREVTRPVLEFVIRSFGGNVGWDPILGAGSPFAESDPRITHQVVDRPAVSASHPGKRVYVQPQWVVDSINRKTLLPTDEYKPGATLPPHLSPFVDADKVRAEGGYIPQEAIEGGAVVEEVEDEDESDEEIAEVDDEEQPAKAVLEAASKPDDEALLHAAELDAETRGVSRSQFEDQLAKAKKASSKGKTPRSKEQEEQLASIMLTGKQKKLYNKMSYSQARRDDERTKLEARKRALLKGSRK